MPTAAKSCAGACNLQVPSNTKESAIRPNRKGPLVLAVLALVMLASGAAGAQTADDRVTADQVVDDETLKAFVEGAAAEIAAITGRGP